ncbi:MAG: Holliday junction resolvase RuvX [Aquiluna sp.]|nr:Holliday junction resolvase RuvX [Aquiluna sp.]MCF8545091.1 Holliday junction resolvase RuvX [Aquiluna sp.]
MTTRLGIDAGEARIGVALNQGSLCLPIETLQTNDRVAQEIAEIAASRSATAIYVGLPLSLGGSLTPSSQKAIGLAKQIQDLGLTVRLIDERLTTKSAQARFHQAGKNTKNSRSQIDAASAAVILEFAIASEKDGSLAGKTLEEVHE